MAAFDLLKKEGGRLHALAFAIGAGMFLLLGGLWFVQIVHGKRYETDLKRQSFRRVSIPAIRGRILDRNGQVLADDRPQYNAILYLEDLQSQFTNQFYRNVKAFGRANPALVNAKGRVSLTSEVSRRLKLDADCAVVSNITYLVSTSLREPRVLNTNAFLRHYNEYPYVPFQIVPNLAPNQVGIFAEQWYGQPAIELETQPVRVYPNATLAAHILGYVQRRNGWENDEIAFTTPDYTGVSGVENVYNDQLRGQPGVKSVLINSMSYRQREEVETPNQPGEDVYLTIDLDLQRAAEKALSRAPVSGVVRGAVVVMDPRNGDILAMASSPSFDPNDFATGQFPAGESARLMDRRLMPEFNRAVTGAYPPGSTFKIITGLACLENGLDPNEVFDSPGYYQPKPGARKIEDHAGPGQFDFERAFYRSSNTYFIVNGLKVGLGKILEVAHRFHLGEKTGISTKQEVAGDIPDPANAAVTTLSRSAADMCIGQEITATPLQMAGMISVIANGGTLYWPRIVSHARSSETGDSQELVAQGRVRDHVEINPRFLGIIRHAMLEDTERAPDAQGGGTAYAQFHDRGGLGKFRVAGKTGTAEVKSPGSPYRRVVWFDSYAPYEEPRYAVVVMVEDGGFGGTTCGPVARAIYEAIVKREQSGKAKPLPLARN